MNKIPGYDESPAFTGESQALPAGKYICVIKGAKDTVSSTGRKQFVLLFDIAEGDYKGYYNNRYQQDAQRNGTNAKWQGVFRQGYEGKGLPYFHGMMTSIEESNAGYKWDWNENGLKGKRIGIVFGREQFRAQDGSLKWATKPVAVRSIEGLKNAKVPEDKPLTDAAPSWGVPSPAPTFENPQQGFYDIDGSEDDLPF